MTGATTQDREAGQEQKETAATTTKLVMATMNSKSKARALATSVKS